LNANDPKGDEEDDVQGNDEANVVPAPTDEQDYPICSVINTYLQSIFVIKKQQIRMYDLAKANLRSLYTNVFNEDEQVLQQAEITQFKIDKQHRKAYISNNHGQIIVINCQNGAVIKNVTDDYVDCDRSIDYDTDDDS